MFEGDWKEDTQNSRALFIQADGRCHLEPVCVLTGCDFAFVSQEEYMNRTGRRACNFACPRVKAAQR